MTADWEWARLLEVENPRNVRYDGTYLAYTSEWGKPLVVVTDSAVIMEHRPVDDSEWIIQDVELGDHCLAVVENTELAAPDLSRLVVYDLRTGDVQLERTYEEVEGRLRIPNVSISGRYMALSDDPATECITTIDLEHGHSIDKICADHPVRSVELDSLALAFDTHQDGCLSAWSKALYRPTAEAAEYFNRECWSNHPVTSGDLVAWFESPEGSSGVDTLIGETGAGSRSVLGRGSRNSAEACWNRVFWNGGNRDVRLWDGSDSVVTIYEAAWDWVGQVNCVGPWITITDADGILVANSLTQSPSPACAVVDNADRAQQDLLAESLLEWVADQFDDLPDDLDVSVGGVIGLDGWWVGHGGFSSHLEGAVFAWNPAGDIRVAWSGSADSTYEIRSYMLTTLPDVPPALLGCVDVDGYADV